ncbi:MAG: hypothetical protein GVY14_11670 [Spirochaetes bacterium]|nr:hypothetical protein [Spirochaetota bacterium]
MFGSSIEAAHRPRGKLSRLGVREEQCSSCYLQTVGKDPEYANRCFEGVIQLGKGVEDASYRFAEVRCRSGGSLGQKLVEGFFFSSSAAEWSEAVWAAESFLRSSEDVLSVERTRL